MKYILILVNVADKDEEEKQDMPDFSCDVDVISAFTACGALQMFTAYERNSQDLCFNLFS